MKYKQEIIIIILLVFIFFSISVVSATESLDDTSTDELVLLSNNNELVDTMDVSVDTVQSNDSADLGNNAETDESENGQHQKNVLGASNSEEPILAANNINIDPYVDQYGFTFTAIQNAINAASPGDNIFLNGGIYTKGSFARFNINKNVTVYGGSEDNPTGMSATLDGQSSSSSAFNVFQNMKFYNIEFINFKTTGSDYNTYHANIRLNGGVTFDNCRFENFIGTYECIRVVGDNTFKNCTFNKLSAGSGHPTIQTFGIPNFYDCNFTNFTMSGKSIVTNEGGNFERCHFENLKSNSEYGITLIKTSMKNSTFKNIVGQSCIELDGSTMEYCSLDNCIAKDHVFWAHNQRVNIQSKIIYCNFTNSEATYNDVVNNDNGQFGVLYGTLMDHCIFINTTNQHHGGAFCILDHITSNAGHYSTSVTNCKFINVTTWSATVYLHGVVDSSVTISTPNLIENCSFINCNSSTWSGALGISHDNVIVNNCNFTNNTAKEGSAIMIGGIAKMPAFVGDNTQGSYVTISNCYFEGNVATNENIVVGSKTYTTTGGTVFVQGHDNTIVDCTFVNNTATKGKGTAIYAHGVNTVVNNSKFYNHTGFQGTVYIEGNNAKVIDSTFENNTATDGAAIYIIGANTQVNNNNFTNNTAINQGGAAFINGNSATFNSNVFISNEASR